MHRIEKISIFAVANITKLTLKYIKDYALSPDIGTVIDNALELIEKENEVRAGKFLALSIEKETDNEFCEERRKAETDDDC